MHDANSARGNAPPNSGQVEVKKNVRPPTGWRLLGNVIAVVVLLALAVYLETRDKYHPSADKCELLERTDAEGSAAAYADIVDSGYRNVRSRRVTVIFLRKDSDPGMVLGSVCEQRWYIAGLVRQLAASGANAIVLDKFFGQDSCPGGDKGTTELLSAVRTSTVPIIVGMATHPPDADPKHSCLILSGSLDFGNKVTTSGSPPEAAVSFGLTRLNSDPKKIPLDWFVYPSDSAFVSGLEPSDAQLGTLSFVAARLVDHRLWDDPRLEEMRRAGQHPFTSFIEPAALSRSDALSILCSGPAKPAIERRYKIKCAEHPMGEAEIRGRVIMIGEDIPGLDQHRLFNREVSGAYLQANYIESLLDDRYLRPLGAGWNFAIFVTWLVFLYLVFWIQPEAALILSVAVGFLVKYGIRHLVMSTGLYPDLWVQNLGTIALALKYIESRGHRLIETIKERRRTRSAAAAG